MNQFLFVMVGISGSGKTTIAKQIEAAYGAVRYESDAIRKELWGDAGEQKNPEAVFSLMNERARKSLEEGKTVVYDATNLNAHRRTLLLKELKKPGEKICAVCCLVRASLQTCIDRRKITERRVDEEVIKRQKERLQEPTLEEGWNFIRHYNT